MIDARMEELMWLEIDGVISPVDHQALAAYVDADAEAREHFEALRRMVNLFDRAGEIDPPTELHGRILHALRRATPPQAPRMGLGHLGISSLGSTGLRLGGRRVLGRVEELLAPRRAWRLAATGALGILIGVVGYHFAQQAPHTSGPLDVTPFYGAMSLDRARVGSSIGIDIPGAKGTITIRRDESRVLSDLEISSEGEIEVVLLYGGTPLKFLAGDLAKASSNGVSVKGREVHVRNQGEGTYHILYALQEDPTSPVTVRILSGGRVLFEKGIPPTYVSPKQG
jgi:hypothetical protein